MVYVMLQRCMIERVNHKGLKRSFEDGDRKLLRPDLVERISKLLAYIDAAKVIEDLDTPSPRLHPLKGDLQSYWAIYVRANWRIVFRFAAGSATAVELIDYH